jgi:hypothetical protein
MTPGPGWIPRTPGAHQRLWIDVVRRAQPGYVAASAALLALASSRQHQVTARDVILTNYPRADALATSEDAGCQRPSTAGQLIC